MPRIPLSAAQPILEALDPRVLFSDIDGTLVGQGGSLFAGFDGSPTLSAAQAIVAAHASRLRIVLISGRHPSHVLPVGRLIGTQDAITELGACLVIDGETTLLWGDTPRDLGDTPAAALSAGPLPWLLARYKGRIEPHGPLPPERQGTLVLRGQIDLQEANRELGQAFPWACLQDNGRFNRPFAHLGPERTHAFHLAPVGVSKESGVREYLQRLQLGDRNAAAIGDAPSDLEIAGAVGAMFLVSNGGWALRDDDPRNIIVTEGAAGEGWAEAVSLLVERRKRVGD